MGPLFAELLVTLFLTVEVHNLDLEEARTKLASSKEQDVRQGAQTCAELDNVEAVEALLEVLNRTESPKGHLPAPHYRDIAWEGLERISDRDAQKRIIAELRSNRDNPHVRQWCAELLGIYGSRLPPLEAGEAFGPSLVNALGDSDPSVKQWAALSLGRIAHQEAERPLLRLVKNKNPYVRANALESLARINPDEHRDRYLTAIQKDKNGGARCALLGALADVYPADCEPRSALALEDEDWRPRLQGVENLGRIRTKSSIFALIEATKDGRPVVMVAAVKALQRFTKKDIYDYAAWKLWWEENGDDFEFPQGRDVPKPLAKSNEEKQSGRTKVAYHDMEFYFGPILISDQIAFLIDKSTEMKQPLKSQRNTKEAAATKELDQILGKMRGRLKFNVIVYHEQLKPFARKALKLNGKTHKRAVQFAHGAKNGEAKDIWNLLKTVIEDPDLDTAYLLSSGEPDIGLYVHWNRVTAHLRDLNRFHKVVVHTIAYSERQWYRDQMQKIAEATHGEFRWFE